MTRLSLALAAALLASAARPQPPAEPAARYALETKDVRRVVGTLTFHVTCPDMRAKEWVVVAAAAPELPGQAKPKTTLTPAGSPTKDRSPFARPLLSARVPVTKAELQSSLPIRVVYEATLRSRLLVELPPDAPAPKALPLPPAERKLFLGEHGDVNFKHDTVQRWLREEGLVRGKGEDAVGFARRVFRTIRDKLKYAYAGDLDRRASAVCAAGRSDCGGLAVLFVAALRANGVPARTLYGRWAASADPDAKIGGMTYFQWHVKAEFFADGIGWVPADPGSAVLHDKSPDAAAFFATDPGDFLTFHVGPNLSVEAGTLGMQAVGNLQTPGWWAVGAGTTTTARAAETWTVEPGVAR